MSRTIATNQCGAKNPLTCRYHGSASTVAEARTKLQEATQSGDSQAYFTARDNLNAALQQAADEEAGSREATKAKSSLLLHGMSISSFTQAGGNSYHVDNTDDLMKLSDSLEDDEVEVEWESPVSGYTPVRQLRIVKTGIVVENINYHDELRDVADPSEFRDFTWSD